LLTKLAIPPSNRTLANAPKIIIIIYLIFSPEYRHNTKATIPKINNVHKSGISKNTPKSSALITIKLEKNCLVLIIRRFLINHDEKNNTYHSLKNSAGCKLHKSGKLIHHLAQFKVIPIPGINTES
jgi:hypothetical protein